MDVSDLELLALIQAKHSTFQADIATVSQVVLHKFQATAASAAAVIPEANDWDLGSEFGGNVGGNRETTTELERLPHLRRESRLPQRKPRGWILTSRGSMLMILSGLPGRSYFSTKPETVQLRARSVVLFDKTGDSAAAGEVLTCRASCYKEVGENKKAVADCSKVLDSDGKNITVLLLRTLLYKSTEKYRLGAEDLRMVLKIDHGNRLARSTIHLRKFLKDRKKAVGVAFHWYYDAL